MPAACVAGVFAAPKMPRKIKPEVLATLTRTVMLECPSVDHVLSHNMEVVLDKPGSALYVEVTSDTVRYIVEAMRAQLAQASAVSPDRPAEATYGGTGVKNGTLTRRGRHKGRFRVRYNRGRQSTGKDSSRYFKSVTEAVDFHNEIIDVLDSDEE